MNREISRSNALLLPVILLAIFVVPSSISGTAIALPSIAIDTHAPLPSLHWVVNAFNLTFACLTLAWGALADSLGRKRCFLAGVAIYTLASLLSAIAPTTLVLDVGRALAGVGAAAVFSCGIALLSTNFEGAARVRVFALFGTVAGLGVSLGPTISGLLLDAFGWRSIFYAHAVILLLVLLSAKVVPQDGVVAGKVPNFDFGGAFLFSAALFVLMIGIVQGSQWGWDDWRVLALAATSLFIFVLFWSQERRHATPMLDLSLLNNGPFVGYSLITVAGSFGFVTLLTYFPSYLTSVSSMSATQAGLTMLLLTAPMLVCPIAAGKLVARGVSSTRVLIISLFCLLVGITWLALVSGPSVSLVFLTPALLLIGAGYGLAAGLVDGLALHVVPDQKAGMAAGLLNTFRLGSEAIAVSLYGAMLTTLLYGRLRPELSAFESDGATVQRWMNDVAAGNFDIRVPVGRSGDIHELLSYSYDSAFHSVLWMLFGIVIVLTVIIARLIRRANEKGAYSTEVEITQ
ncbi:MFS transporter [Halomonas sp. ISL-60]|uniref:MFS transporter n=1 Tax=Halomonas sp. ISL-56 TaxID=2819149 RepID=UPI001BE67FE5|nr:MFS transporter [Halomonas sp. ISL-56]MBT2775163.1 MFS transporter [Halomonas sp. ISL-60]MBT2802482.1 MFS transporter [Halomonas sp. ISL-56]